MTKILGILASILMAVVGGFWGLNAFNFSRSGMLDVSAHQETPFLWSYVVGMLILGIFIFAAFAYFILSFRYLDLPKEAHQAVLDHSLIRATYKPPLLWLKICASIHIAGTLLIGLGFFWLLKDTPFDFNDLGHSLFELAITSIVLLFLVTQLSYVYRSWRTIKGNVKRINRE